jgi:hypothetical protein
MKSQDVPAWHDRRVSRGDRKEDWPIFLVSTGHVPGLRVLSVNGESSVPPNTQGPVVKDKTTIAARKPASLTHALGRPPNGGSRNFSRHMSAVWYNYPNHGLAHMMQMYNTDTARMRRTRLTRWPTRRSVRPSVGISSLMPSFIMSTWMFPDLKARAMLVL